MVQVHTRNNLTNVLFGSLKFKRYNIQSKIDFIRNKKLEGYRISPSAVFKVTSKWNNWEWVICENPLRFIKLNSQHLNKPPFSHLWSITRMFCQALLKFCIMKLCIVAIAGILFRSIPSNFFFFLMTNFNHILYNELDNKPLTHSYQIKKVMHKEWRRTRERPYTEKKRYQIEWNISKYKCWKANETSLNRIYLRSEQPMIIEIHSHVCAVHIFGSFSCVFFYFFFFF